MKCTFLFIDESGNFDFGPSGTEHFVFGCLCTRNPRPMSHALSSLRYDIFESGLELERFHAAEDKDPIRNQVFDCIAATGDFEYHAVIIEKARVPEDLRAHRKFYTHFADPLIQLGCQSIDPDERIVVITDRIPVQKKRRAVEKTFKQGISHHMGDRPYSIMHHGSSAHGCLQAVDYLTWAVYRKWRLGKHGWYNQVHPFIRTESDLLAASPSPDEERGR